MLASILVHPDTHEPLNIDWEKLEFIGPSDDQYDFGFKDKIPFVLPKQNVISNHSPIHNSYHTAFDYKEHYTLDAEFFDYFDAPHSAVDREERKRLDEMIVKQIPSDASCVLDVGCGNGWLSKAIVSEKTHVLSMDISSRNPLQALRNNPHPNHEAFIADVYHLPLRENSVDCIVASEIIEHVVDPKLFLEKLLYVLKPDGKLIITTPYNEHIVYYLCVHCNRPTPANAHLHSFNEKNISDYIPKSAKKWKLTTFSHKYFSKSRVYVLLSIFPFWAWKTVDYMANKLWKRPVRFMIEIDK